MLPIGRAESEAMATLQSELDEEVLLDCIKPLKADNRPVQVGLTFVSVEKCLTRGISFDEGLPEVPLLNDLVVPLKFLTNKDWPSDYLRQQDILDLTIL